MRTVFILTNTGTLPMVASHDVYHFLGKVVNGDYEQ